MGRECPVEVGREGWVGYGRGRSFGEGFGRGLVGVGTSAGGDMRLERKRDEHMGWELWSGRSEIEARMQDWVISAVLPSHPS